MITAARSGFDKAELDDLRQRMETRKVAVRRDHVSPSTGHARADTGIADGNPSAPGSGAGRAP